MRISEHAVDAAKASPVAGFIGSKLAGFQWDTASYIVATLYTCFLIAEKLYKWYQAWRAKRAPQS